MGRKITFIFITVEVGHKQWNYSFPYILLCFAQAFDLKMEALCAFETPVIC